MIMASADSSSLDEDDPPKWFSIWRRNVVAAGIDGERATAACVSAC